MFYASAGFGENELSDDRNYKSKLIRACLQKPISKAGYRMSQM